MSSIKEDLERSLDQAVKDGKIPHAIVYATNRDGSFQYSYATGFQHYGIDDEPIQKDAVLLLASQSKLLTSICALQAVEQGYLTLDEDLTRHLPEFGKLGILQGFDANDKPLLTPRAKPITLRHLLTHTSGAPMPQMSPDIIKHQKQRGLGGPTQDLAPTILQRFDTALISEPGDSWYYSPNLDWISLLLQRLTGLDLEAWLQQHICGPLSLRGITFWPNKDPALADRIPQLVVRTPEGALTPSTGPTINTHSTDCFGSHGIYAPLDSYLQIQRSLLANDGRLLQPSTVDRLFAPQLGPASVAALESFKKTFGGFLIGEIVPEIPLDHGLGGAIYTQDVSFFFLVVPRAIAPGEVFYADAVR